MNNIDTICNGIGATRLDKIELQDGRIVEIMDIDRLIEEHVIVNNSTPTCNYVTDTGQQFSYLSIKNDSVIHRLKAGGTGYEKQYVNLQTGVQGDETGNLIGNTVGQYQAKIIQIEDYLEHKYGIIASFAESNVKSVELNRTFRTEHPFEEYNRVLNLILAEMPRMNIISTYSKTVGADRRNRPSTYTAWSGRKVGKSKQCKIVTFYDKSNQMRGRICLDGEFMRFEIKLVGLARIKKAFGTAKLYELTDQMVSDYFREQIGQLIIKPMARWMANRDRYILRLMNSEYKADIQHWQVNVLRKLTNQEIANNGKPCLLDVEELIELVDRLDVRRKQRIKDNFRRQVKKYESVLSRGDDKKLHEIIGNLIADDPVTVVETATDVATEHVITPATIAATEPATIPDVGRDIVAPVKIA